MSNFLVIFCLSVFCSKDKDRQASKWGGWVYDHTPLRFVHPPHLLACQGDAQK